MELEWQKGNPPEHGYYLGAWRQPDRTIIVTEVWYNPDASYSWWQNRGYSGDKRHTRDPADGAIKEGVVAWMPIPEFSEDRFW